MLILAFAGKTCSLIFFFLAWLLYKPPPTTHNTSHEKLEEGTDRKGLSLGLSSLPLKDGVAGKVKDATLPVDVEAA